MAIIKWEPFKEFDRFFDDRMLPALPKFEWGDLAVDVYEEGNTVVAKMTLPGVKSDDLDISVREDALRISGKREEEEEKKDKEYYSKEIRRGSFSRVVSLPRAVDPAKASASYKDGILQVTMPKAAGKEGGGVRVKVKK